MTFWQHWHLLIKKTKQIKNTHPPECASWPARSAQDDSGSSSLGSPQSGKKTRCQNHMNSKLLQHHKILFCQFNICFCFHVTCFHHFLALQLTTILQKRQLTRNYLYDNPTTTNLYLWHPSFQFVRFLWGVFFVCFLPLWRKSTETAGDSLFLWLSPLLAPDSSAVRERLLGSSVLHGEGGGTGGETKSQD